MRSQRSRANRLDANNSFPECEEDGCGPINLFLRFEGLLHLRLGVFYLAFTPIGSTSRDPSAKGISAPEFDKQYFSWNA